MSVIYMYTSIIEFCLDAYTILTHIKKRLGVCTHVSRNTAPQSYSFHERILTAISYVFSLLRYLLHHIARNIEIKLERQ